MEEAAKPLFRNGPSCRVVSRCWPHRRRFSAQSRHIEAAPALKRGWNANVIRCERALNRQCAGRGLQATLANGIGELAVCPPSPALARSASCSASPRVKPISGRPTISAGMSKARSHTSQSSHGSRIAANRVDAPCFSVAKAGSVFTESLTGLSLCLAHVFAPEPQRAPATRMEVETESDCSDAGQ